MKKPSPNVVNWLDEYGQDVEDEEDNFDRYSALLGGCTGYVWR